MGLGIFEVTVECPSCAEEVTLITTGRRAWACTQDDDLTQITRYWEYAGGHGIICVCGAEVFTHLTPSTLWRQATQADIDIFRNLDLIMVEQQ